MRISKSRKIEENTHRIVLINKTQELKGFISDPGQRSYVQKRLAGDKDWALLNQLEYMEYFVGLEKKEIPGLTLELARKAGFELHPRLLEGLALTNYQFLKYLNPEKAKKHSLREIQVSDEGLNEDQVLKLENLVKAVYLARDLVNEPLSFLTAEQLSVEIEKMGSEAGFSVEVFNKKKIEVLKMGGLLAVNRGSVDPPTFSILTWKPEQAVNQRPIVLVGKGVVFDTGGLSLKPTQDSMDYMKCDMGGAAAVAGALYAVAKNGLPVWVVGLVPATDNRPDGNAYVPGDVVTMYDGTTVEVLNTDAEGRMLLADALSYAKQYDPELVVELSTLTGSAQAAIDKYGMVGMGKFPFWDEYKEQLKSEVADLKNIGGKYGGAITAGKFLEHFTDYPFIHLDIAGPSFNKATFKYHGKGASGVGVRILYNFLLERSK